MPPAFSGGHLKYYFGKTLNEVETGGSYAMLMTKKIFSVLLAVFFLFSFIACASDTENGTDSGNQTTAADTTAPTEGTTVFYEEDSLPTGLNFGGQKVVILSESEYNPSGVKDVLPEITVEELTSDVINDSIFNRELFVENRLGVEIENYQVNIALINDEINKQYNSHDDTYDIFVHSGYELANYVFNGFLMDLYEVEHLDFSKPWWSDKFTEAAEIDGSLYEITGSLSLTLTRYLYAIFYNKTLAENYSDAVPELSNLYEIVKSGDWTFDKYVALGGDIYNDVNGDTIYDLEDEYGIFYPAYQPINCIWSCFDIGVLNRTEDGWFELDVNTDKLYAGFEKLYNLLYNTKGSFTAGGAEYVEYGGADYFANGNILFHLERLGAAEWPVLRNMQDDYGILPFPKFDEIQKEYYSYALDRYSAFSIPNTNDEADVAGAVLEAMASYSYRETEPAFLDLALKGKYMTDGASRHMVDMVVDGFTTDAVMIYRDTLGKNYLDEFISVIRDKETSFASTHEKSSKIVKIALKIYRETYNKANP